MTGIHHVTAIAGKAARNCNQMTGDGEMVTPLLPEPGVWTGMA
jgi:hypothetical protein